MQSSGQLKGWGRLQEQLLDRRAQVLSGLHSANRTQVTAGHTSSRFRYRLRRPLDTLPVGWSRGTAGNPPVGPMQVEKTAGHSSSRLDSGEPLAILQSV